MSHGYNLRRRKGTGAPESAPKEEVRVDEPSIQPKEEAPSNSATPQKNDESSTDYKSGTNWVHGGGIEANPYLFVLIVLSPFLSLLLAYITSAEMANNNDITWRATHPLTEMIPACLSDVPNCVSSTLSVGASVLPTFDGAKLVLTFMAVALVLERTLPGNIDFGPETATGHVPKYVDNGVAHCFVYSILFFLGSNLGPCGLWEEQLVPSVVGDFMADTGVCDVYQPYNFGVLYDLFPSSLSFLNIFGIIFCIFLMYKGIYFPSTQDNGSSGTWVKDYLWGTELYPRVFGLDLKRFVNCRFSMTFWQLAGFSFCYRSYVLRGNEMDWGLFFSALSQYLYLVKFFFWVSMCLTLCILLMYSRNFVSSPATQTIFLGGLGNGIHAFN